MRKLNNKKGKARDSNSHRAFFHGMAFPMQHIYTINYALLKGTIKESAELSYKHTTYLINCGIFVQ